MALLDQIEYERMSNRQQFTFVISGWLNSYKEYWQKTNRDREQDFYKIVRPKVSALLEKYPPLIAVLKEDPFIYLGFCCGKPGTLYYVYVKGDMRRNGIANALIREECGDKPGVYCSKSYKQKFLNSLEEKGWKYEE